jgi:hypothetical protein
MEFFDYQLFYFPGKLRRRTMLEETVSREYNFPLQSDCRSIEAGLGLGKHALHP